MCDGGDRPVPEMARDIVGAYLSAVDEEAPGLVEGLYLTGSVALGDFRPGASDIDFVAVTAAKPTDEQIAAVRRAHDRVSARYRRPFFDGPYVTWDELAGDPLSAAPGPYRHRDRLAASSRDERHPVTWHTLTRYGTAFRGPLPGEFPVHADDAGLRAWTLGNLDTYWRSWRARAGRLPSPTGLACLSSFGPVWAVLGVSRLHHTLVTGAIISKAAAGDYARDRFDVRWHPIVAEALRIRRGGTDPRGYRDPLRRRRDTLAFMDHVIEDAHGFGEHQTGEADETGGTGGTGRGGDPGLA
ncbi:nucleotidyltransferase domain-containing protein [Rugosimonospora africana]|uniref:Nucleotidyltransferase domain-containing protein n=1 Tax=Rugosimonospora africana TaxID=556532 RepID=A0A8J3VPE9_9ACTN|nr:nucleotidyltransferase domain-containing protein [Rugosimonospora africana]GIH14064.1 hypothetical protein Raf01_22360 [Rugosimonospora africana]